MGKESEGDVIVEVDNQQSPPPPPSTTPLLRADLNILDNFNQLFVLPGNNISTQGMVKFQDNSNKHVLTFETIRHYRAAGYHNLVDPTTGNIIICSTIGGLMKVSTSDKLKSLGEIRIVSKGIDIEPAVGTEKYSIRSDRNVFYFPYGVNTFIIKSSDETVGIIKKKTSESDLRFSIEFTGNIIPEEKGLIIMAAVYLYDNFVMENQCCGFRYPSGAQRDPLILIGLTFCVIFPILLIIILISRLVI